MGIKKLFYNLYETLCYNYEKISFMPFRSSVFQKQAFFEGFNSGSPELNYSNFPSNLFSTFLEKGTLFFYGKSYINTFFSNFRALYKGLQKPYYIRLSMKGVGYRAWGRKNKILFFKLGFTHKLAFFLPLKVKFKVHKYKFLIFSSNKTLLTQVAKFLLQLRLPDAYKGKGIRYANDKIFVKSKLKDAKRR